MIHIKWLKLAIQIWKLEAKMQNTDYKNLFILLIAPQHNSLSLPPKIHRQHTLKYIPSILSMSASWQDSREDKK